MSRRAHGEGSLTRRKDGRWCGAVRYQDPATGEQERAFVYGKTKTEARAKLKEAISRLEAGSPVRDSGTPLTGWLSTWEQSELAASSRKPTTKALYSTLSRVHLRPAPFGTITLDRLRPSHVNKRIAELRERGLSESTLRQVYHVLRTALDSAVAEGLLAHNPCAKVKRPVAAPEEAKHLSPAQVTSLLSAARKSRYHNALVLLAATGMRRGEALALKWRDIDLEKGTLRVRGTLSRVNGSLTITEPKTAKSKRSIALSPALVSLMTAHRATQRRERLKAANIWTETGHVFTTETGQPVDPRNLFRALQAAAKKAKLKDVGLHTLRHSAATAMLENRVPITVVSEVLGHSSVAITGDIYGHVTEDAAREATDALAAAIGL